MFDSASAASQVPLQARTHHSPAQAWTITDGIICIANTEHAVLNQKHDLFIEGRLKSIANVTWKFLVQLNRLLSDRGVERYRLLNRFRRRLRSPNDFDQRDHVWRIEWMTNQNPLGVFCIRLHHAGSDS